MPRFGRRHVLSVVAVVVLMVIGTLFQKLRNDTKSIAVLENRGQVAMRWFRPFCPQSWLCLSLDDKLVSGVHIEVAKDQGWIDGRSVQQVLPFEGPGIVVITVKKIGLWEALSNKAAPITYLATMYECPDGVTVKEGEAVALFLPPGGRSKVHVNPYPDDRWWEDSATVSN